MSRRGAKKSLGKSYRLRLDREFRCRHKDEATKVMCSEDIYNCRDLVRSLPDFENGGEIRIYVCPKCLSVWVYQGHRYVEWAKLFHEAPPTRQELEALRV